MRKIVAFLLLSSLLNTTSCQNQDRKIELIKIKSGISIAEGFIFHPEGYFLFTEVNTGEIWKLNPEDNSIQLHKTIDGKPARLSMHKGEIYFTDHKQRNIRKISLKGNTETVVKDFQGKQFNSPMSPVFTTNGFYFSDPNFLKEGNKELTFNGVYFSDFTGNVKLIDSEFKDPNEILISAKKDYLYIMDYGRGQVYRYTLAMDGSLTAKKEFINLKNDRITGYGLDGGTFDKEGNLWLTGGPGILVYSNSGTLIRAIKTPEFMTNLCWNKDYTKLYATAYSSIYEVKF